MADLGHELTEEMLQALEERIAEEYAIAAREMREKTEEYFKAFRAEEAVQKKLLEAGEITEQEFTNWRYRHMMVGKRWEEMRDVLAADLEHTSEIALSITRGRMADVYALNANYCSYRIEHDARIDAGFTLYNHDTAEYLLAQERQLMPGPSSRKAAQIAADKAMQWDRSKIQSAVLQGVLQGESPYKIAERLNSVAAMSYNASVRYARTMTTSAQNAGRYESFHRAKSKGIELTIEWQATLDGRTRHEHRLMHGQRRKVDEPFEVEGVKILYPAQSDGPGSSDIPQRLIWNCRCTLLGWVNGFEGDTVKSSPKMGNMSFEEWQHAKEPKENAASQATTEVKAVAVTNREGAKRELSKLFGSVENSFLKNDEELIVQNTNQILKLNARFGAIPKDNSGGYITGAKYRRAMGYAATSYREEDQYVRLGLVNQYYKSPETLREAELRAQKTFWSMRCAKANIEIYTVTHEYGHILESYISRRREDWAALAQRATSRIAYGAPNMRVYREAEKARAKEIWREIVAIARESNPSFKVGEYLSEYGRTNYYEAFAETFANSQLGEPNELGLAMIEWLKREGF